VCIDLDYYSSYSYALYYSWNRHVRVLLGHAVVDGTEVWLDPTDNRAHNRVVSTAPGVIRMLTGAIVDPSDTHRTRAALSPSRGARGSRTASNVREQVDWRCCSSDQKKGLLRLFPLLSFDELALTPKMEGAKEVRRLVELFRKHRTQDQVQLISAHRGLRLGRPQRM
jgi:hypothetical protein